jgi:bifunctional non-homologous end joining protein LigD
VAPGLDYMESIETTIGASGLMLATLRTRPFSDPAWVFEWKYDGYRCLVRKHDDRVDLISREGNSLNRSFSDVVTAVAQVAGNFVWDAELTVDDQTGHQSFERLQKRAKTSVASTVRAAMRQHPARLYLFDMLTVEGEDIRPLSLLERKHELRESFEDTGTLVFVNGVIGAGQQVFELVKTHGFEGMVAKRLSAPYRRGRSSDWLKIKNAGYGRPAALGFRHRKPA